MARLGLILDPDSLAGVAKLVIIHAPAPSKNSTADIETMFAEIESASDLSDDSVTMDEN